MTKNQWHVSDSASVARDSHGMPEMHFRKSDGTTLSGYGTLIDRAAAPLYGYIPHKPEPVEEVHADFLAAIALVDELDDAAEDILTSYHDVPGKAQRKVDDAVKTGKKPPLVAAQAEKERAGYVAKYQDTVRHRNAVFTHAESLERIYARAVDQHVAEWRDAVSADLSERVTKARELMERAAAEATAVHTLAQHVDEMDNPTEDSFRRCPKSATDGRSLPEAFTFAPGGNSYAHDRILSFTDDLEAANRLASHWLTVEGRSYFPYGPIPEALTTAVCTLPQAGR